MNALWPSRSAAGVVHGVTARLLTLPRAVACYESSLGFS
jgi:hypothetical protein